MPKRRKAGRLANYEFVMKRAYQVLFVVRSVVIQTCRAIFHCRAATNKITHEFVNNWSYAS